MLLVGAVLFAQSFIRAQGEDPGYPAEQLLIVDLDPDRFRTSTRFFLEARSGSARCRASSLSAASRTSSSAAMPDQWVTVEGRRLADGRRRAEAAVRAGDAGYFRAVGIEIVEGRDFEDRDLQPARRRRDRQ